MFFVGIDLAWSEGNPSGIAVIQGERERCEFLCGSGEIYKDEEIIEYIMTHTTGKPALVAVDASLIVKNDSGERAVETQLKRIFARYHAVPYPSNRKLCDRLYGGVRGERLAKLLEEREFRHDPYIEKSEESKKFFEVFPHSAMVVIFQLKKILKYKARKDRSYNQRWQEFARYQSYLKGLQIGQPCLYLPPQLLDINVTTMRGKSLKGYEDLLDAVFCAYFAFYYWSDPQKCTVIGNVNEGCIVTARFTELP